MTVGIDPNAAKLKRMRRWDRCLYCDASIAGDDAHVASLHDPYCPHGKSLSKLSSALDRAEKAERSEAAMLTHVQAVEKERAGYASRLEKVSLALSEMSEALIKSDLASRLKAYGVPSEPPQNWEPCNVDGCIGTKGHKTSHVDKDYQPIACIDDDGFAEMGMIERFAELRQPAEEAMRAAANTLLDNTLSAIHPRLQRDATRTIEEMRNVTIAADGTLQRAGYTDEAKSDPPIDQPAHEHDTRGPLIPVDGVYRVTCSSCGYFEKT